MQPDCTSANLGFPLIKRLFQWHSELFQGSCRFVVGAFRHNLVQVMSNEQGKVNVLFTALLTKSAEFAYLASVPNNANSADFVKMFQDEARPETGHEPGVGVYQIPCKTCDILWGSHNFDQGVDLIGSTHYDSLICKSANLLISILAS
uniref:Uncharacterized protein n=1 Tax=Strigamia maritima TaxID=126957 RepID=T1IHM0_STRMM